MSNYGGSDELDVFEAGLLEDSVQKLTAKKLKSSIPNVIQSAIALISFNPDDVSPFGSWLYRSQMYPGDIDLIETSTKCCNKQDTIKFYVDGLKKIVRRINKKRGTYLGDIKAGIDYAYKLDIGKMYYSKLGEPTVEGYKPEQVAEQLTLLKDNGLLTNDEYDNMISLVKDKISELDYENLYDLLRDKWLLRWSSKEILQGYKKLDGNRKITLGDAIQMPTMTKIDMWYEVAGRYLEITDVYVFYSVDKDGNEELLNFANDVVNLSRDLKKEVQKYAFSKKYYKPFKMVKRMWSIARMIGDDEMIQLLTPLMQSDLGRLSQINSEFETLISMLENIKSPPLASIMKQLDYSRYRLANVYEVNWDEELVDQQLIDIIKFKRINSESREYIIDKLSKIKKYFTGIINEYTIKYLDSIGLIPIPFDYLPNKYDKNEKLGGCNACTCNESGLF